MTQDVPALPPIKPNRTIRGASAILLPFLEDGAIDWESFDAHLERTAAAGLTPAVNMDTGYVNLITSKQREAVLTRTQDVLGGGAFVAGAFVKDEPGAAFDLDGYALEAERITARGGQPVVFQSYGLTAGDAAEILPRYEAFGERAGEFIGFELTPDLAAFGKVYSLETFRGLLGLKRCVGSKHSSFHREPEWERIRLRDELRPDFRLMTGNDFAIDMVMWGSDYLLGLSTFAPDLFAQRDKMWAEGDPAFFELNDELQYLGRFAFRAPGAGYKHSAAQFLKLRGWLRTDLTHPNSPERPDSDVAVLRECAERLGVLS
ncbi:dihydrodipicolinate synthase family protein [Alienimonas sp. DA493]|uniref:dihydrodipicolinate synthase family protein n=1 Tax=Alienimonas sp. DA493 TaxID=3373605 RepID=UPI0037544E6A